MKMRRASWWLVSGLASVSGVTRLAAQQAAGDSATVFVAARALPRGTVLQPADMIGEVRALRHGAAASVPPAGWVTRRVVRAGEVLSPPAVVPPPAVTLGQRVDFIVSRGGVELSVPATATSSATIGDTVAVRLGALRRATGIVAGPTRVIALTPERDR